MTVDKFRIYIYGVSIDIWKDMLLENQSQLNENTVKTKNFNFNLDGLRNIEWGILKPKVKEKII